MERPPEFLQLKAKIERCTDFTLQEKKLLLDAFNLGHYADKHSYPRGFDPRHNRDPFVLAAWAILDQMQPDAMTVFNRWMLGGMLAGALNDAYRQGQQSK